MLARVFDIVGWELISEPLAKVADILNRCATHLRTDLGGTPLQARSVVKTALKYWQQVGLIEQVRHGTTTFLTFVHKTFAEFAAARFLWTTHEAAERARLLSSCVEDYERWSEVVVFASTQMGEEVLQALSSRIAIGDRQALERALGMLVEAPACVSDDTAHCVLRLAFAQVDRDNTVMAYRLGLLFAKLASRFEPAIGKLASARLDSSQLWTQRVAWACAVDTTSFDIEAATTKLRDFPKSEMIYGAPAAHFVPKP